MAIVSETYTCVLYPTSGLYMAHLITSLFKKYVLCKCSNVSILNLNNAPDFYKMCISNYDQNYWNFNSVIMTLIPF